VHVFTFTHVEEFDERRYVGVFATTLRAKQDEKLDELEACDTASGLLDEVQRDIDVAITRFVEVLEPSTLRVAEEIRDCLECKFLE